MNFIGSRESTNFFDRWKLFVWRTETQLVGVTVRNDGLTVDIVNLDGTNFRSKQFGWFGWSGMDEIVPSVYMAYRWIMNEIGGA